MINVKGVGDTKYLEILLHAFESGVLHYQLIFAIYKYNEWRTEFKNHMGSSLLILNGKIHIQMDRVRRVTEVMRH